MKALCQQTFGAICHETVLFCAGREFTTRATSSPEFFGVARVINSGSGPSKIDQTWVRRSFPGILHFSVECEYETDLPRSGWASRALLVLVEEGRQFKALILDGLES